uniref:Uncharacterized protein n=1 Tax=Arundo donax TaxID=35708 RepID=A0A0A9CLE9_ARUDO
MNTATLITPQIAW